MESDMLSPTTIPHCQCPIHNLLGKGVTTMLFYSLLNWVNEGYCGMEHINPGLGMFLRILNKQHNSLSFFIYSKLNLIQLYRCLICNWSEALGFNSHAYLLTFCVIAVLDSDTVLLNKIKEVVWLTLLQLNEGTVCKVGLKENMQTSN